MIDTLKLQNTDLGIEITIDRFGTTNYLLADDGLSLGTIVATHNSFQSLSQIGVDISSTNIAVRDAKITGWIWANVQGFDNMSPEAKESLLLNKINEAKEILNKIVNPLHQLKISLQGYHLNCVADSSPSYAETPLENNEIKVKFMIDFTCSNPMFIKDEGTTVLSYNLNPLFHFPLIIPKEKGVVFGSKERTRVLRIDNNSDIDLGAKFTIISNGSVVNPKIINVNTQEKIQINKTLVDDEVIVISTERNDKYIEGGIGSDPVMEQYFQYWDYSNSWLTFKPGTTFITFEAESESHDYMELQVDINEELMSLKEM